MDTIARVEMTVGKRLLQAFLQELRLHDPRFATMNEFEQEQVIYRIRGALDSAVRQAVDELAAGEHTRVPVSIEQIAFKDGAKIVLKAGTVTEEVIEVAQEVGSRALLVLCDPSQHVADMHTVKAQPNQRDLLEGAPTESSGEGKPAEVITTVVDETVTHEHPSFEGGKITHTVGASCIVCAEREQGIAKKLDDGATEPEHADATA